MYSRFSPNFVEACRNDRLRNGEKMPCPKCGHEDVQYIDPRKWLRLAGVIGVVAIVLFVFHLSVPGQVVAIVAVGIAAASLGTESSYKCRHCDHGWRFRDAVKWAEAIKQDQR